MKTCQYCSDDANGDDERFCTSCGGDMDADTDGGPAPPPQPPPGNPAGGEAATPDEPTLITRRDPSGRLVLNGGVLAALDGSYRLVGRADLRTHTAKDPDLISRSHFTAYKRDLACFIKDGVTPVQDRPSKHGTLLNGDPITAETELKDGDVITVSDVEITFEA